MGTESRWKMCRAEIAVVGFEGFGIIRALKFFDSGYKSHNVRSH